jgi:hypothetical protein
VSLSLGAEREVAIQLLHQLAAAQRTQSGVPALAPDCDADYSDEWSSDSWDPMRLVLLRSELTRQELSMVTILFVTTVDEFIANDNKESLEIVLPRQFARRGNAVITILARKDS